MSQPLAPDLAAALPAHPRPSAAQPNPAAVYLGRLAPSSRPSMTTALGRVAELLAGPPADPLAFPWHLVRYAHVEALRAALTSSQLAPTTANRHLAAVRGVITTVWKMGLCSRDECDRATGVPGLPVPDRDLAGRTLGSAELRALFEICNTAHAIGARDAALVGLLYGGALRRSEVVGLDVDAFDAVAGELRVRGKGSREHLVHVTGGARAALAAWLGHRGSDPGPLLYPVRKSGAIVRKRMSAHGVFQRMRSLARRAGLRDFSPHDLRRSSITDLFDAGSDPLAIRDLARHSDLQTTARYDRRGERGKRRAAEMLMVPFVEPAPPTLPIEVVRLLGTYDVGRLRWDDLRDRWAIVGEVLASGGTKARAWLAKTLPIAERRALVVEFGGAGLNEPQRARVRAELGLTETELPVRPFPFLGMEATGRLEARGSWWGSLKRSTDRSRRPS